MADCKGTPCSGCGAMIEESLLHKAFYMHELEIDRTDKTTPRLNKIWRLYLCHDCAATFDKALERATKWEMEE